MYQLSDSEIRNICKEKIESLEHWLRRLIDESLRNVYGDFFAYEDEHKNRLISKKTVESLTVRINKEPNRYSRKIDAVLLDDAISIICKPNLGSGSPKTANLNLKVVANEKHMQADKVHVLGFRERQGLSDKAS